MEIWILKSTKKGFLSDTVILTALAKSHCFRLDSKDNNKMYDIVKKCAIDVGYTKKRGLPVNKNNNLVKRTWQKGFGYSSGTGNSNYMWTYSTLKKQIDSGNPCMFSIANGYYYNHTVAVVGYKEYKNMRTGKVYTFLVVHDGWSTTTRYIAMKNTGASYVACQTSIKVPLLDWYLVKKFLKT